ncbi:hypothetical protein C8R44DRAFT_856482 [Mycena epipterygia]|nr:hypothetical protein C8R44DRAFT_856482 [Mycena epipterygia]
MPSQLVDRSGVQAWTWGPGWDLGGTEPGNIRNCVMDPWPQTRNPLQFSLANQADWRPTSNSLGGPGIFFASALCKTHGDLSIAQCKKLRCASRASDVSDGLGRSLILFQIPSIALHGPPERRHVLVFLLPLRQTPARKAIEILSDVRARDGLRDKINAAESAARNFGEVATGQIQDQSERVLDPRLPKAQSGCRFVSLLEEEVLVQRRDRQGDLSSTFNGDGY